MKQPIGSRLHGLLDYLTGTGLVAASRLPALRGRFAGRALAGAGLSHVAYSLVTDYELGLVKRLPYRAHLGLDAAGALGLAAAGATRRAPVDCLVPVAVGAYELGAVLLSDPSGAPRGPERHAVTVGRSEAEVRAFLADPANVEGFSPEGQWSGSFELRRRPRRARHGDPRDGASGGPPARQADARGGRAGHGRRPGGSPRRPERGPPEARHGQGREVKAVTWAAPNRVACEATPDPSLVNRRDAILKVTATTICGSDLHLYDGYVPAMQRGDILGHEFMGEVVDVAPGAAQALSVGDRVVVSPMVSCGSCFFCREQLYSMCDNGNPDAALPESVWGFSPCGIFGYWHLTGGYPGSHAEYIRVPFADVGAVKVPDGMPDDQALFCSDALATGYFGADLCDLRGGEVVAVWGAGAVGLSAISSAVLMGAEGVVAIDSVPARLRVARDRAGATDAIDFKRADVVEELKEITGGRGPDACIDAVGMEASAPGIPGAYDRVKQAARLESDRPYVLREAIQACRKGGTIALLGVYGGFIDKFPIGALMNKGIRLRTGQVHAQRYSGRLLEHIGRGELDPSYFATHEMRLDDAQDAYQTFKKKKDDCLRVVFRPHGAAGR